MADRTAYFAEYWSRPEVIAANRAKSKRVAEKKKLKITARRLTEHSLDDLLDIAKKRCEEKNLDWESHKQKIKEVFEIFS